MTSGSGSCERFHPQTIFQPVNISESENRRKILKQLKSDTVGNFTVGQYQRPDSSLSSAGPCASAPFPIQPIHRAKCHNPEEQEAPLLSQALAAMKRSTDPTVPSQIVPNCLHSPFLSCFPTREQTLSYRQLAQGNFLSYFIFPKCLF